MEIVIAAVLVIVAVATFVVLARGPHPDDTEPPSGGSGPTGEHYPPGSRPAGPGAEAQNPNRPGAPSPDPDA